MDDLCIHDLAHDQCAICKGTVQGPDPRAVAGGLKAAAARAGRVRLPPNRFAAEVDSAITKLRSSGVAVTVSGVQQLLRDAGYEAGRRPTKAALEARGLIE